MEATLDEVRKYCGLQLKKYGYDHHTPDNLLTVGLDNRDCIERHGSNWEVKCLIEKKAVTQCAAENVPSVRAVKERCNAQIEAYELCVQKNAQNPQVCVQALRDLYDCTHSNSK
ncbi:hypothetical protein HDU97_008746 [Phlyctochytrium planicorne]|nr:hypothetical protein HDU97_008746 [Phlyctochytrium planicorne]